MVQIDEVRSGGSYLSHSDLRIHFGLDNADKVDRVEIRGPSGQTEVLQNLPAIREGLRARHIGVWLAQRNTAHDSGLGRWRWVIEGTLAWLNQEPLTKLSRWR